MTRTNKYHIAIALLAMLVTAAAMPAYAQTETVLYEFGDDSARPRGAVAQGLDGAVYLTASSSGLPNNFVGGVFRITASGKGTDLHDFCQTNCADGSGPVGGLTLRPDGHFLGITGGGGSTPAGKGTIFDVTGTGQLTTIYDFTGGADGGYPEAAPILGPDGSFYGVASVGGGSSNCGTIYKLTQTVFTVLYQFDKVHGCNPAAPMVLGTDGNFYGTTVNGGTEGGGVVFQLKLCAGKSSMVTVLANFDQTNGYPWSPVIQGSDGNFYGTTSGTANWGYQGSGTGMVFKITASGTLTALHTLNGTTDGSSPFGGLVQATDGNLYGTAAWFGTPYADGPLFCNACGTLFQVTPGGTYSVLYNFEGFTGFEPSTTLLQHTNGLLYGGTLLGGGGCDFTYGCGVVYSWNGNLPPFVTTVQSMGSVGGSVEILGQGFNSSTTVAFNGTPAEVHLQSATSLYTQVPAGATTGFVTVTTSTGTLSSNKKLS